MHRQREGVEVEVEGRFPQAVVTITRKPQPVRPEFLEMEASKFRESGGDRGK